MRPPDPRPDECHHPANGLLPWYVKGTLQGAELAWVEDHVESCDSCAYECDALDETPVEIVSVPHPPRSSGRRGWAYLLTAGFVVIAAATAYALWIGGTDTTAASSARLAPAAYLDLGVGPTRAADPLHSIAIPSDAGSLVVSFFPPLTPRARYTFDLEGPRGLTLVRQRPIGVIDGMGRCTYAFPSSLFFTTGKYAIVVRVAAPDGETRLYPYPFEITPPQGVQDGAAPQRQSPASTNPPQ